MVLFFLVSSILFKGCRSYAGFTSGGMHFPKFSALSANHVRHGQKWTLTLRQHLSWIQQHSYDFGHSAWCVENALIDSLHHARAWQREDIALLTHHSLSTCKSPVLSIKSLRSSLKSIQASC